MIKFDNVSKVFGTGAAGLSDITLQIDKGEFVFLVGHTGSGKTTLLRLLIRESLPTKGVITIADWDVAKLSPKKIPQLRRRIGVVFQDLKLLLERTIFENILLPLEIANVKKTEAEKRAKELLEQVGILEHKDKFPVQLSGGELQRAAIARALTLSPLILLADEPTGNLDTETAGGIVKLLADINENMGTTIIMATHDMDALKKYPKNRVVTLHNGKLVEDKKGQKDHSKKEEAKLPFSFSKIFEKEETKKTASKDSKEKHESEEKNKKEEKEKEEKK